MKYFFVYLLFFSTILIAQPNDKTDSTAYYSSLSNAFIQKNNYKDALLNTQKAILYAEKNKKIKDQAQQNLNLGKIYFDLKKFDDAIDTLLKSAALFSYFEPSSEQVATYYHIGLCYMQKQNYDKAPIYFERARSINDKLKISEVTELLNLQKGLIFKANNQLELAISSFKSIIAKTDNAILGYTKAEAFYQLGQIEAKRKRNNLSLNYLNKALDLNSKSENLEQKSNILLALSVVYEKVLDKNNAYFYLKQHLNLKENITILNNERLGIDDYKKFKESEKLKEIAQTEYENKEQEKANKFSKLISIFAIALISILSLLSLSLYKNNIIKKQSNLLLQEKNKELEIAKDKAEKASKARSEFLSTVSHELRTPLNAINGITHLLLEENPKKNQLDYLSSLKFSGDYLTKFINEILEINKIDSQKCEIEYTSFNLKELLKDIKHSLKELALVNNNNFKLEIDASIPDYLIGDPTKLSQIILNLINNALKFTKNGTVTVITNLKKLEDKKANLYFEITDTGIGIPEDKLASVFDSFSQGSIEVNRKYGGTGLGLTIVKKLIKILGGHIKLKSVVGEGSTFTFDLEFQISPQQESQMEKKPIIKYNAAKLLNKKILLVEDNKINQMVTRKMLDNKGIICEIIDNGEDAINLLKTKIFDLVLMDVHLPGINGTIATETIRTFDNTTPIIALTAISLHENREMLLSFGMNDVITKPFVPEEFYKIIAENI
ncbi:tetratricopeptide repeat-containing hybrid sensor histidine kinase/response regulator [Flavobacterium glaciei]|uniref:histidine kinase n=1 Tax=Flavobacterium glaciei TaxID=386300 RepID=A0A562Q5N0_9FLAO|nr:ATP-binding protein [Flavobacterium glaciei]RDI58241.1 signal transduction histidine kinase [Flavobacterium glaciei]TWI52028.1 signal transduction histidine kinase [Flavobacterium glaciei]